MAQRPMSIKEKITKAVNKGFLFSLFTSVALTLALSLVVSVSRSTSQWKHEAQQVHKSLEIWESNLNAHAKTALYSIEKYLVEHGLNDQSLDDARKTFGIDGIFLIDQHGKHHSFTHETCYKDLKQTEHWYSFNLLKIDPSYVKMQKSKSLSQIIDTPIKWIYKCEASKIIFGWSNELQMYIEIFYTIASFRPILENIKSANPNNNQITVTNSIGNILISTDDDVDLDSQKVTIEKDSTDFKLGPIHTEIYASAKSAFESKDTFSDEESADRESDEYYYNVISVFNNSQIIKELFSYFFLVLFVLLVLLWFLNRNISSAFAPIIKSIHTFSDEIKSKRGDNFFISENLDEIEVLQENFNLLFEERAQIQKQRSEDIRRLKSTLSETAIKLHNLKFLVSRIPSDNETKKNSICYILESTIKILKSYFDENSHEKYSHLFDSMHGVICSFVEEDPKIDLVFPKNLEHAFVGLNANIVSGIVENLVSNSYESEASKVRVVVSKKGRFISIRVSDNGAEFPKDLFKLIKKEDVRTSPKEEGMGIGLHETFNILKNVKGKIKINEKPKYVEILLPIVQSPAWYLKFIDMSSTSKVVLVDDEIEVYNELKEILGNRIEICYYKSPEEFLESFKSADKNTLYAIDYCFFDSNMNGIDLITKTNLGKNSILLTASLFKRIEKGYPDIKIYSKSRLSVDSFININEESMDND